MRVLGFIGLIGFIGFRGLGFRVQGKGFGTKPGSSLNQGRLLGSAM